MSDPIEIQENERIAFDNGKVEVDTGSNALDFIIIFSLIIGVYVAKKLIDRLIKNINFMRFF